MCDKRKRNISKPLCVQIYFMHLEITNEQIFLGRGHLTLKFKNAGLGAFEYLSLFEGKAANEEFKATAPYLGFNLLAAIYIDQQLAYETPKIHDCFLCSFHETYNSGMIYKNASIMVDTVEKNLDGSERKLIGTIVRRDLTYGTIDDYLHYGLKFGMPTKEGARTYIETTAIWQDEFQMGEIANMFLAKRKDGYEWPDQFHQRILARERTVG